MSNQDQPKDISDLRARRRDARRRRYRARVDIGLGLLASIVLLLATPGLAITAIIAFAVLGLCAMSVVLERRRARRPPSPGQPRQAMPGLMPPEHSEMELRRVSSSRQARPGRANGEGPRAPAYDRTETRPSRARAAKQRW